MPLTCPIAILWLLLSAGDPAAASDEAATPGAAPTPDIEIVLAGPHERRAKLEIAIRAVVGSDVALAWSGLDSMPEGRLPPDGPLDDRQDEVSDPRASRIWVDMRDPAKVRVYLPAEPRDAVMVRTVWRPEGDAEDGERMAREEIVQIVKTAVLALQGKPRPAVPSPDPIASHVPVTIQSKPSAAVTAVDSESFVERAPPFSLLLGGGLHTQPRGLSNNIGQKHWLGPSLLAAGRWQVRRWQIGLRFTWERSDLDGDRYDVRTDLFSSTVAAAYRFPWRWLSLSLGLQTGLVVLHQEFRLASDSAEIYNQAGTASAAGPLAGPVLEMDLAISRRLFLHLDAAVPTGVFRIDDGITRRWDASVYFQTTLGLGFRL